MPRWLKILLILLGSAVALIGLCIGGFAWWLSSHRAELRAQGKQAEQEGQAYAGGTDSNGCIRESVTRLASTKGFMDQALLGQFLDSCLKRARRDPSLCNGVPETRELMQSAVWRVRKCIELGRPDDAACGRMIGKVQDVCHPR